MSTIIDKDAEIERLKKIIHSAHFALLTCRAHCVGQTTLQQFNSEKVRRAVALTEDVAVETALDELETLLSKKANRTSSEHKPLTH